MTERMMTASEVALLFRVSSVQVVRWAKRYPTQLGAVKATPRGAWLFPESKVTAALTHGLKDEEVAA